MPCYTLFQVFDMLPTKSLSGYPYNINEEDSNPCTGRPPIGILPLAPFRKMGFFPHFGKLDVYSTFKVRRHAHSNRLLIL